jgi:DNA-binding CsgD family transcriptional regulator
MVLLRVASDTLSVRVRAETKSDAPAQDVEITDLNDIPTPSQKVLQRFFNLSPAEARVAQSVASGASLEETAQALGIKISTARTQLAAVFAKTQTRRQPQLIALLMHVAHILK